MALAASLPAVPCGLEASKQGGVRSEKRPNLEKTEWTK